MISYVQGDLLQAEQRIIAHGCNTVGRYAAGVAAQIARRWPQAREQYLQRYRDGEWRLGDVQLVDCGDKIIANLGSQASVGRRGRHVDYVGLELALQRLIRQAAQLGHAVAMPKIGTGLGGGEWQRVEVLLRLAQQGYEVPVTIYSLK